MPILNPVSGSFGLLVAQIRSSGGPLAHNLGLEMRRAAGPTVRTARANASWSSRIPQRISARMSQSRRHPGARIVVKTAGAPHARPYEWGNKGRRGSSFRHPVFGRDDISWVTQQCRPYLTPAVRAHKDEYVAACDAAVLKTVKSLAGGKP